LVLSLAVSCGIQKKPHYSDKTFGQERQTEDLPMDEENANGPRTPETEEPPAAYDQLLSHYGFSGYFNMNTVHRIVRGSDEINGEISAGGVYDSMLASLLTSIVGEPVKETLEMVVRQSNSDHNLVTQKVETTGGDNIAIFKGEESQSGTQYLDWVLPSSEKQNNCPDAFVCIERMVWVPVSGETMTYCYRDPKTKKSISIPYSPNSQFSADAIAEAIGSGITSRPIEVYVHPGKVNCDDQNLEVRDRRFIIYKLSQGNLADQNQEGFLRKAIHRSLNADMELIIEFSLYHPELRQPYLPKQGPFIDQLTRLNSKMKFYLNSVDHVIMKLERTVQSPFSLEGSAIADAIRETYGEVAAYIAEILFPKDGDTKGVQIVYSFEFCTHLGVIQNPFNHCTGKINPH
jgi:hypothetical protein